MRVRTYMVTVAAPARKFKITIPVDAMNEREARDIVEDRGDEDWTVLSVTAR